LKAFQESFARFFEEPTREGLRNIIELNIGEQDNLDFKSEWPAYSKMAKHILAFSNSGGGCIIIGVQQNKDGTLESRGLDSLKDKAEIEKGVNVYIPNELKYEILDFSYSSSEYEKIIGKKFQVILVESNPEHIPFISKANNDGQGIRQNAIYIRRGTSSEEATYEELQKVINKRIETGYSTSSELKLEEHLAQLKVLYASIEKINYVGGIFNISKNFGKLILGESTKNPNYPEEDFEQFIARMISSKKLRIEKVLDIK
jgi:predicted HTH transcriptional regulator